MEIRTESKFRLKAKISVKPQQPELTVQFIYLNKEVHGDPP